jgi:hypothetical protein
MHGVSFARRCALCVQRACCDGTGVRIRYGSERATMPRLVVCPHCDRAASLPLRSSTPGGTS